MLVAIWHMLNDGTLYSDPGDDFYTRRNPERSRQRAVEQLQRMGYTVTLEPVREVA
jgi:hypothetical protein